MKAKLIRENGQMLAIEPENGRNFTLRELYEYLDCDCIEVVHPPGRTGPALVIDESGKNKGKAINQLATRLWQEGSDPGSGRAFDPINGHAILCSMEQLKDDADRAEAQELAEVGPWKLLPPAADVCQECAAKHDPAEPHNKQSLFYQYYFFGKNGRWPTWADALAHCSQELKAAWTRELLAHGEKIE